MTMSPAFRDSDKKTAQLGLFGEDAPAPDGAERHREEPPRVSSMDAVVHDALAYLNDVTERTGAAKFTSATSVKERIRAGAQLDDLLLVIDFCRAMWWGDTKMETFIRPRTLFGKENFPEYLVRGRKWHADGRPSMRSTSGGDHERGVDYYAEKLEEAGGR